MAIEYHGRRSRKNGKACPTYRAWISMKTRCYNANNKDYKHYGAKGIKICSRWRNSFEAFLSDMGDRPSGRYSIDRKDNKKGYTLSNCRWATIYTQNQNRGMHSDNTSGHKGINKVWKGVNKIEYWEVRIQVDGKRYCVGTFKKLDDAIEAREKKVESLNDRIRLRKR